MSRTYGKVTKEPTGWRITAEPHILLRMKRVFERIHKGQHGSVTLADTPENCHDLEWFMQRYPLAIDFTTRSSLAIASRRHREHILTMEQIADPEYKPQRFNLALPLREYQSRAAQLYLQQGFLLLADDVGLGKTAVGIGSLSDPRTLPALVVTKTFLPRQWRDEIKRFAPGLSSHIITSGTPYELAAKNWGTSPDVLIINYHKLCGWAEVLSKYCKSVIFDEVQELRRDESNKYSAAMHIARGKLSLGLSATPIYNYGGEIFNVLSVIRDGCVGRREEFYREWCVDQGRHQSISDPKAFGSYLRENFIMLRRTRAEVGRELPPIQKIVQPVDSDTRELLKVQRSASELAQIILRQGGETFRGEKMQASERLSNMLRQATGIAKAPFVAQFVRMLVENGERVLLGGWHREVYTIWHAELKDLRIGYFTGTESLKQKQDAKDKFVAGELDVLMMSLRSGEGVDGLQGACNTVVIGELDWAPGVHEQFLGRIHRDGQTQGVAVYFLLADDGADPVMAEVLGLKRQQIEGIRNPKQELIETLDTGGDHVRRLAEKYLNRRSA